MLSWLTQSKNNNNVIQIPMTFENVSDGLRSFYQDRLLPLEEAYHFHDLLSPKLDFVDFEAKPMILLIGQYSTGKTSFIRYLLQQDFPGMRIGPEPTTDRFMAIMHGEDETSLPGSAVAVDPTRPFRSLSIFGNAFLNRFQCSLINNPILQHITFIDTPGILSGDKQRIDRGYDFAQVIRWFAERVDRIILLFDAHKLDISDEFKKIIENLKGCEEKIRIVLNKCDMVDEQPLMRIYGALMWSLGKVLRAPEVSRVYIGSFRDNKLQFDVNRLLFEHETSDLFDDIQTIPRSSILRKISDLVKRTRLAMVHAYIINHLYQNMPSVFGKETKKKELILELNKVFVQIQRDNNLQPGDFPDVLRLKERLEHFDFSKLQPLKPRLIKLVEESLEHDLPGLMQLINSQQSSVYLKAQDQVFDCSEILNGPIDGPFEKGRGEGFDWGWDRPDEWAVSYKQKRYNEIFESLQPVDGQLSGACVKQELLKSHLPTSVLAKIWRLSDLDRNGLLDCDEFALAMYLVEHKMDGWDLPNALPLHLLPISKRMPSNKNDA